MGDSDHKNTQNATVVVFIYMLGFTTELQKPPKKNVLRN